MNITIENPTDEQFAELLKLERERIAAVEETERQRSAVIQDMIQDAMRVLVGISPFKVS